MSKKNPNRDNTGNFGRTFGTNYFSPGQNLMNALRGNKSFNGIPYFNYDKAEALIRKYLKDEDDVSLILQGYGINTEKKLQIVIATERNISPNALSQRVRHCVKELKKHYKSFEELVVNQDELEKAYCLLPECEKALDALRGQFLIETNKSKDHDKKGQELESENRALKAKIEMLENEKEQDKAKSDQEISELKQEIQRITAEKADFEELYEGVIDIYQSEAEEYITTIARFKIEKAKLEDEARELRANATAAECELDSSMQMVESGMQDVAVYVDGKIVELSMIFLPETIQHLRDYNINNLYQLMQHRKQDLLNLGMRPKFVDVLEGSLKAWKLGLKAA